jgi:hypothetical protein
METEKLITLLSIVAILLIIYRILITNEDFEQVDICDYNSPNPNDFCKSIQKGCTDLIAENNSLNDKINTNCTKLPTDTRDMIDTAITCDNDVNKLIMNNYVKTEVCSQIKNFNEAVPSISPINKIITPDVSGNEEIILNSQKGYAPF